MSTSMENNVTIHGEGNNVSTVFGSGGGAPASGGSPKSSRSFTVVGDGHSVGVDGGQAAPTGRPATGTVSHGGAPTATDATGPNDPSDTRSNAGPTPRSAGANAPDRLHPVIPPEVTASITPPQLREGATYDAHLHNLEQIGLDAERAKTTAELTLSAAVQAQHRATQAVDAVELMAQGLAAQDFGEAHVANMNTLAELYTLQARHAQTAVNAANESMNASEQADATCRAAVAAFRRDHGPLADAYQSAPHPAKTREAYQQM